MSRWKVLTCMWSEPLLNSEVLVFLQVRVVSLGRSAVILCRMLSVL